MTFSPASLGFYPWGLREVVLASTSTPRFSHEDNESRPQGRRIQVTEIVLEGISSRGGGTGFGAPGFLDLGQQEVPHDLILKAVIDRPEDTELMVSGDQLQNRPETFGGVKILHPTPLLPGVDGEQLQGILGGQRPLCLQFPFTLKKDRVRQMTPVRAGRRDELGQSHRDGLEGFLGPPSPRTQGGWA